MNNSKLKLAKSVGLCLLVSVVMAGCRTPSSTSALTVDQEKTIGDWAAAQIQSESVGPTDPAILSTVNNIANKLQTVLPAGVHPRLLISDSDVYTVTSLPGGWVVISSKTVTLFQGNTDALAGLIAHEFAHVEYHDAAKQMTDALGADTTVNITTQGKYLDASNVAVQLMNFGNTEDSEYRADAEGVRIAEAAGYDPNGIVTAIATLRSVTPTSDAQWLVVHPVSQKRLKLLSGDVAEYITPHKN